MLSNVTSVFFYAAVILWPSHTSAKKICKKHPSTNPHLPHFLTWQTSNTSFVKTKQSSSSHSTRQLKNITVTKSTNVTIYMEHHCWRINHKCLKNLQSQATNFHKYVYYIANIFVPKLLCLQSTVHEPLANTHRILW